MKFANKLDACRPAFANVSAWLSRDGYFFLGSKKVYAVIPGLDVLGRLCAFLVVDRDDASHGDFYEQGIEIVIENIEWVLAQEDPDSYRLSWNE